MKAISLLQPWATLVALGIKRFETRSWRTNYRGPLAIHASERFGRAQRALCATPAFQWALRAHRGPLPRGCVIATCTLAGCDRTEDLTRQLDFSEMISCLSLAAEFPYGDFTAGRFAWHLIHVSILKSPIPAKGSLGLWELESPPPPPRIQSSQTKAMNI